MVEQHKKHLIHSCVVIAGLLPFSWHRAALGALPPAPAELQSRESGSGAASPGDSQSSSGKTGTGFVLPPVQIGGRISYDIRSESSERKKVVQQGVTSTINAKTGTYIWEPWFAQLTGEIGINVLRRTSDDANVSGAVDGDFISTTLTSKNLVTTGALQLDVLRHSRFPFQGFYRKSDNRIGGSLSALGDYANQSFGFTQGFGSALGTGTLGWDRNQQTTTDRGKTSQDGMRFSLSKALTGAQSLTVNGMRSDNRHPGTSERAVQTSLNAQHRFTPGHDMHVDTLANASRSAYRLKQGHSTGEIMQLSSFGMWRPDEWPLTLTGGARLHALENSSGNDASGSAGFNSRSHSANVNVGAAYEISNALRATAGINLNTTGGSGAGGTSISESVGLNYQPEGKELGEFRYNWSATANASHASGGEQRASNLAMQLGHVLSRSLRLNSRTALSVSANQAISTIFRSGDESIQWLTHSGSVSWNTSFKDGMAYASVNASDSRSFGEDQGSFQLINFQLSSNLSTGRYSSLTGNLTIQSVRQEVPSLFSARTERSASERGFVTTSSGSVIYQHQRAFGVPRLRFRSELRLNSQALLPVLGGPQDSESASWSNHLDYSIGRVQLRADARVGKAFGKNSSSIMFTASRAFGSF